MKTFTLIILLLIYALPARSGLNTGKVTSEGPNGSFELSVTVTRADSNKTILTCKAEMRDVTNNKIISLPKLIFEQGKAGNIEATESDTRFSLSVTSSGKNNEVVAVGQLTRGGKLIFKPKIILKVD